MFQQVIPLRTADAVFGQVRDQIVGGGLTPGDALPAERELSQQLGVSRGVVREALQRLAQAGLVDIKQGGSTRVRDYRTSTDMDLLQRLLVRADKSIDPRVLRSLLEMRISIGAHAARLCAERADAATRALLGRIVDQLEAEPSVARQQDIDLKFWGSIIDGSQNIVYRLAYNGLVATYHPLRDVISAVVEPELRNISGHRRMVSAIARGKPAEAERAARLVLESSSGHWAKLLDALNWEEQ